jgi:uncharacterized protein YndB with AHSA1/START domain
LSLTHIPTAPEVLELVMDLPGVPPETAFAYWTQPELLIQWWPQQAETEQRLEGRYHLSWPAMQWHLRGRFLAFVPGQILTMTWKWDSEAQEPGERIVHLIFQPDGSGGTRLYLTHGLYADTPADQKIRIDDHLAGWTHFLPKLLERAVGQASSS